MPAPFACPVCRAVIEAGSQCRRCKADLSLLFALEARRDSFLAAALRSLASGRADEALTLAHGTEQLRRGKDARQVIATAHLLRRDFAAAWRWYT
jgi:hypothetical protein